MKMRILSLSVLFILLSCQKESDTSYTLTTNYLENVDLYNCVTCFTPSNINAQSGFVIRDESTYQLYADSMRIHPLNTNCDTATVIDIDFNSYTLLGIMTAHGGCDSLYKHVSVDNQNKTIIYTVDITNRYLPCADILYLPLNLVLIPKIPDDFNVKFFVNRFK